jgi:hypothetical protein
VRDFVGFFERNRALVDANHQAMPVEPRVAQRWWQGYEAMADAMPGLWQHLDGAARERARLRVITALVGSERICWFAVLGEAPIEREALVDALTEDWYALLRRR